jgi:hypothetical protein
LDESARERRSGKLMASRHKIWWWVVGGKGEEGREGGREGGRGGGRDGGREGGGREGGGKEGGREGRGGSPHLVRLKFCVGEDVTVADDGEGGQGGVLG